MEISSLLYAVSVVLVLVLGGCGRAGTAVTVRLLLLSLFVGVMPANKASGTSTERHVIAGEVTCRAANDCAFQTSRSLCVTWQQCRREKQGRCTYY